MEIHKRKSTSGFQSLPYVVALFSAMLWMYYAFLKSDAVLLISINSFGCLIETIYIVIYLVYASKESRCFCSTLKHHGSPAVDARNKKKSGSDINDGPKDDQLQNQHKQIHDNYEKIASSAPVQPSQPKANVPLDSPPPLVTCTA
ncbi:hypothetical protein U1Q18_028947 [Sarracenia purpurea var. burkii]